jgi:hypothetical protein
MKNREWVAGMRTALLKVKWFGFALRPVHYINTLG